MLLGAVLCSVALLLSEVDAQVTSPPFEWGFTGPQPYLHSLPSCQTFSLKVTPLTTHGVPPFYMITLAIGQAPMTSFIGNNASALSWQVLHPNGTRLLLTVIDSNNTSGGVDPPIYNVTAGSSTQCLPPPFSITANVTDTLATCEPWGLSILGGTPPYRVTLAALNAPVVKNVTFGPNDSVLTYINRAVFDTQMIGVFSPSRGPKSSSTDLLAISCR
ncbi:hypothetical protein C8R46DRAFT_989148 [Mycena filopes]|nr:hypothetical protein C8R46DRAFT_989148 [Mycena filopes]